MKIKKGLLCQYEQIFKHINSVRKRNRAKKKLKKKEGILIGELSEIG